MRLQILDLARNDLIEGFRFYEDKEKGLGRYFLVSLYSDIEALKAVAFIGSRTGICTERFRSGFHSRFTTPLKRALFGLGPLWIAASAHHGFASISEGPDFSVERMAAGRLCPHFWTLLTRCHRSGHRSPEMRADRAKPKSRRDDMIIA